VLKKGHRRYCTHHHLSCTNKLQQYNITYYMLAFDIYGVQKALTKFSPADTNYIKFPNSFKENCLMLFGKLKRSENALHCDSSSVTSAVRS
jgi:hypothetical protein